MRDYDRERTFSALKRVKNSCTRSPLQPKKNCRTRNHFYILTNKSLALRFIRINLVFNFQQFFQFTRMAPQT